MDKKYVRSNLGESIYYYVVLFETFWQNGTEIQASVKAGHKHKKDNDLLDVDF